MAGLIILRVMGLQREDTLVWVWLEVMRVLLER